MSSCAAISSFTRLATGASTRPRRMCFVLSAHWVTTRPARGQQLCAPLGHNHVPNLCSTRTHVPNDALRG